MPKGSLETGNMEKCAWTLTATPILTNIPTLRLVLSQNLILTPMLILTPIRVYGGHKGLLGPEKMNDHCRREQLELTED